MKNIHVFKVEMPAFNEINDAIRCSDFLFRECGENEFSTFGFSSVDACVEMSNGYRVDFTLEAKMLPKHVISREVEKRAKVLLEEDGVESLNREQISIIKEQVTKELVTKALTSVTAFSAFYHSKTKYLVFDISSFDTARRALGILCDTLKSITTTTLHVSEVSNSLSTNLLDCISKNNQLGFAGFTYGDKLDLVNIDKETVKFRCDYTLEHVSDLLTSGYKVKRVRLAKDAISFDLTDNFEIKSIKSLIEIDDDDLTKPELKRVEQETELEIMAANLSSLVEFFDKAAA